MENTNQEKVTLKRDLGLLEAINIIIGIVIGGAIFIVPATIYAKVSGIPAPGILVWVSMGILSILGALCYAELGAMMPKAGGAYVYLREAYGPIIGFLNVWQMFVVIGTGSIAALAISFGIYVSYFFPLSAFGIKVVAVVAIIFLTMVNYFGVRYGGIVQNIFSFIKVGVLLLIILAGLIMGHGFSSGNFTSVMPAGMGMGTLLGGFGLAMISAAWAYEGWANVGIVAEEIKNPQRNIPIAYAAGVGIVTIIYCLASTAYLNVIPMDQLTQSSRIAGDVAKVLFGPIGGALVTAGILMSIFGSTNGCVLVFPR